MTLLDPQEMVRSLLDAQPGTKALTACRRCSGVIHGLAALDDRGFFVHPDECEPQKAHKKPEMSAQFHLL